MLKARRHPRTPMPSTAFAHGLRRLEDTDVSPYRKLSLCLSCRSLSLLDQGLLALHHRLRHHRWCLTQATADDFWPRLCPCVACHGHLSPLSTLGHSLSLRRCSTTTGAATHQWLALHSESPPPTQPSALPWGTVRGRNDRTCCCYC